MVRQKGESTPVAPQPRRCILGSILSAFAGWIAFLLLYLCLIIFQAPGGISVRIYFHAQGTQEMLEQTYWRSMIGYFWVASIFSAILIFGTWLVILLPLYSTVPKHSPLWKWPICTACGVVSGAAIMFGFGYAISPSTVPGTDYIGYCALAGVIGGITCLFGSVTRKYFRETH